jgi:hypothetical protein
MKMNRLVVLMALVAIVMMGTSNLLPAAQTCDRQCLVSLMQNYLAALVKHDPTAVPFDKDTKFTENTANIPVGDGLWVTATGGPTTFQVYAADPVTQQVAALVVMKENSNKDVLLGVRLALRRGKISEAEHHVVRDDVQYALPNLQKPRPGLVEDQLPADSTPRNQMLDIGLAYYDALTGEDGTLAPFAEECERRENGSTSVGGKRATAPKPPADKPQFPPQGPIDNEMAKLGMALAAAPNTCEAQISTGVWAYITEIKNRRLLVIDEQKGLAVGFSNFYHDSKLKTAKLKGIPGMERVRRIRAPSTCLQYTFSKSKKVRFTTSKLLASSCPSEPKPAGNKNRGT